MLFPDAARKSDEMSSGDKDNLHLLEPALTTGSTT